MDADSVLFVIARLGLALRQAEADMLKLAEENRLLREALNINDSV